MATTQGSASKRND